MLLALAAVCTAIVAGVALYRSRSSSPEALLRRLPSDGAVIVSIDFGALRRAGVLGIFGGSKVTQEPEYRAFVEQTGFDYINDLDRALISFHASGTYFILRGRFDWRALEAYAAQQGGNCHNSFCELTGSVPERKISFFPLRRDVMALAVSPDESAAFQMQAIKPARITEIPGDPVWSLIPIAALKQNGSLPPAALVLVRALDGARTVLFAASPENTRVAIRLEATCGNPAQAAALANELREITAHLRDAARTPDPRDLGGVLAAGEFLESLAGGAL
jgi:hypothetical protein